MTYAGPHLVIAGRAELMRVFVALRDEEDATAQAVAARARVALESHPDWRKPLK